MKVYRDDFRPVSAFAPERPSARELLGGLASCLAGLLFVVLFSMAEVGAGGASAEGEAPKPPREKPTVIEASFVQLGREFDPRELPDRQVDRSSFVKAEPQEVASPNARPKPPREDKDEPEPPKPVDAYENLLDQLGNRADYYDRLSRAEMEGSPDGVAEGNAKEGDAYRGTLYALFRRGLRAPSTVPDDVLKGLRAQVEFRINEDLRIRGLRLASGSGNEDFDRAVRARIAEIEESDPKLPEPPSASRATFIGPPIQMTITPPKSVGGGASAPAPTPVVPSESAAPAPREPAPSEPSSPEPVAPAPREPAPREPAPSSSDEP